MMPVIGEAHVAQIFVHVLVQQVHRESVHGGIPVLPLYIRMCVCVSVAMHLHYPKKIYD